MAEGGAGPWLLPSFFVMWAPYFIGTICIHNDGGGGGEELEHGEDGDVSLSEDSEVEFPFFPF